MNTPPPGHALQARAVTPVDTEAGAWAAKPGTVVVSVPLRLMAPLATFNVSLPFHLRYALPVDGHQRQQGLPQMLLQQPAVTVSHVLPCAGSAGCALCQQCHARLLHCRPGSACTLEDVVPPALWRRPRLAADSETHVVVPIGNSSHRFAAFMVTAVLMVGSACLLVWQLMPRISPR